MAEKLTGKRRFRTGFRGKLILQVECTRDWADEIDTWVTTYWRDATTKDLPLYERVMSCCSGCS